MQSSAETGDEPGVSALPVPLARVRLADGALLEANEELLVLTGGHLDAWVGPGWVDALAAIVAAGRTAVIHFDTRDGATVEVRVRPAGAGEVWVAFLPPPASRRADDLGQLVAMLSDVLWEWDLRTGRVNYFGEGVRAEDFEGSFPDTPESLLELIHEDERELAKQAMEACLSGRSDRYRFEHRLLQSDGEYRWMLSRGRVVERDTAGQPLRVMGLVTDIERRRRREEERLRLEGQLRHMQKLDALGQLTGGIAHDFNNILASVLGYAELGLLETDPAMLRDHLEQVIRSAARGRDLIGKLLLFSRAGSGAGPGLATSSLLQVPETLRMLRPMLPATLTMDFEQEPALPDVQIDPSALQQLVLNLTINARDAVGENGWIRVALGRRYEADTLCASCRVPIEAGDWVALEVADDGSGITADLRARVFDPFFSTKESGEGSGLGLSVVHGIVHEHGGHILLDSEPGGGTRFTLLLRPAEVAVLAPVEPAQPVAISGANLRVLVVDDESAIGAWLSRLLRMKGFDVEVHQDSEAALDSFEVNPESFDLVITDQSMPGLSGVELADELLALRPDMPILICSGFSEFVNAANACELGFTEFLQKPVSARDLLAAIGRCLPAARVQGISPAT
ncbi:MAG: response regulator [Gammaproteobacteria bacterium]|nr:response regulator [Gammaproteobacteria bacterium]